VLVGMGLSLAAMGAAAVGLLPAVWGALLQEGIDVAVILNALRALRSPAPDIRMTTAHTALTTRFRTEHAARERRGDRALPVAEPAARRR
jgi:hypothetical protein